MTDRIDAHFVAAGRYHDIDYARLEILKLLMEHPHIRTTVACDYSNVSRIKDCQFLITYCCDLMPTETQMKKIRAWLEAGGKWIALHGTNSILKLSGKAGVETPNDRPDVMEALGTQFKAHPPIGTFLVKNIAPDHPIVEGIEDFEIEDELYLSHRASEIEVLLKTEFEGTADGFEALHWTDICSWAYPVHYELLRRCLLWAMREGD